MTNANPEAATLNLIGTIWGQLNTVNEVNQSLGSDNESKDALLAEKDAKIAALEAKIAEATADPDGEVQEDLQEDSLED